MSPEVRIMDKRRRQVTVRRKDRVHVALIIVAFGFAAAAAVTAAVNWVPVRESLTRGQEGPNAASHPEVLAIINVALVVLGAIMALIGLGLTVKRVRCG